jgi:2,3-bisphosphoglycerate-dependent phosphoglycerate mutase
VDVPLSPKGIEEAIEAGKQISDLPIDVVYTSTLIRAQMTAMLALAHHEESKVTYFDHTGEGQLENWSRIHGSTPEHVMPVIRAWQLNERCYGDLQGLNKAATAEKFGAEQVQIWRRSYDVPPPNGESLKMTAERTIPYFEQQVVPHLAQGQNVLISAHGNSLRSIIMDLDKLSEDEVVSLEIPTGQPILYSYENEKFLKVLQ